MNELGVAELASAEGELPWQPRAGDRYQYADLSGPEGRFATIDYSEEKPIVFKGNEATLEQLGIKAEEGKARRVGVEKLSCSNCGAPLELRAPDRTERIYCPSCGARVVERDWYVLGEYALSEDGHCERCGTRIAGRFDGPPGSWGARRVPVRLKARR